jgi:aldehyde:ferredoxin oxidoreductase
MIYGYAGKFAEVDLTKEKITEYIPDEKILSEYIGGRGLATKILWDRLGSRWAKVDPLGPENLLIALTGPITGYMGGARVCVSGKSPQSNGIVGSTASGEFPVELKCAGYDGVIVKGAAKSPVYILVTDGKVELMDAKNLWGMNGIQTVPAINREVKALLTKRSPNTGLWREPGLLYIGPAGENRVRTAAVMEKWTHACGYGGYGAVMGSKNLKAIVAKGTGPLPEVADQTELTKLTWSLHEDTFNSPVSSELRIKWWGTGAGAYEFGAASSAEPVRNWQEEYHNNRGIGIVNLETRMWVKRFWCDFGCSACCMKLSVVKTGPWKGSITDLPDYELGAHCGPNLGIYDPDDLIYIAALVDDLGFSGINGPNTMAFAAELYERGILTKEDLGGVEPKWGDAKAMGELAKLITERKAIGDVLAEGTYRAAKKISEMKGVDCMQYAVQCKGVEVGAHGIRTLEHFPVLGYALGTQGGDHTSVGMGSLSEAVVALGDSMVTCMFSVGFFGRKTFDFFKAVTGWDMSMDQWMDVNGRRIIQIQRAALLIGGPDVFWDTDKDDDNPSKWYTPLPSGPFKGSAPKREELMVQRAESYADLGWDERGIPTTAELTKLGLEDVDKAISYLRK